MKVLFFCFLIGFAVLPRLSFAHRSGCHTLHTCPSDTSSYVCGDLGYPCDGSSRAADVSPEKIVVPLLVESTFKKIFDRIPSDVESVFWKNRFRSDKNSVYKIRRAMRWHKAVGSFGPEIYSYNLIPKINALFRSVYDGRNPMVSENQYWISRVIDKPSEGVMKDAMLFHRENGIGH